MNATVTNLPVVQSPSETAEIMEAVLLAGDLSKLTPQERTSFYMQTCRSLGLNPLTRPFDYIKLNGREVLYAKRDCADQLRSIRRISLDVISETIRDGMITIRVRATTPDGRADSDIGAVPVVYPESVKDRNNNWVKHPKAGQKMVGDDLANALMKATTKAKRRVTLSICGLGMLDETEVRSAIDAEALAGPVSPHPKRAVIAAPPKAEEPPPPTFAVAVPYDGEPVLFPRNKRGAKEALAEIGRMVEDKYFDVVRLNNGILDDIAGKFPDLAEEISELRAYVAEKLRPPDEPDPNAEPDGFVHDFINHVDEDDDDFPGDRPTDV